MKTNFVSVRKARVTQAVKKLTVNDSLGMTSSGEMQTNMHVNMDNWLKKQISNFFGPSSDHWFTGVSDRWAWRLDRKPLIFNQGDIVSAGRGWNEFNRKRIMEAVEFDISWKRLRKTPGKSSSVKCDGPGWEIHQQIDWILQTSWKFGNFNNRPHVIVYTLQRSETNI